MTQSSDPPTPHRPAASPPALASATPVRVLIADDDGLSRAVLSSNPSTMAAATADPGIDYDLIAELRVLADEEPGFLTGLFAAFVLDGTDRAQAIDNAAAHADWAGLGRAAHGLSGAAATIGARQLSDLCRALEADLKRVVAPSAGAPPLVEQRVRVIRAELERATPLLETLLRA